MRPIRIKGPKSKTSKINDIGVSTVPRITAIIRDGIQPNAIPRKNP